MERNLLVVRLTLVSLFALAWCAPNANAAAGRTRGHAQVSDAGQAAYSIPLHTPPGTNGLTPTLSLNYSSGGGNGVFGNGWSLSGLSGISRCANTWAQDGIAREPRNDYFDMFCLDGQKLRLVSGTYGQAGSTYRTEIESFARITANGSAGNGPASFTVETKSGLVYTYGGTGDSQIESLGQTTIRFWAVSRIRDRSSISDGNAIKFTYAEDTTYGSFRISTIQYTENLAQGITAPYTITFNYEPIPSAEVDLIYAEGAQIRRVVRATQINVTHSGGTLIRRYNLSYEPTLSSTSKSRLASIQECAGAGPDCFSPTAFTYQNATNALNAEVLTSASIPVTANRPFPMDVNGDGRDDLIYTSSATSGSGTWMVLFANSAGGYNAPVNTGISNVNYLGATTIDYDSDGRRDLLVPYSGGTWWVMLGGSGGLSAPVNTGAPATTSGTGSNAQGMDIDGDGREDLVWADLYGWGGGDVIRYRLRLAGPGFAATATDLTTPAPANTTITSGMFISGWLALHRTPDFNGDGRADFSYKVTTREWGDFSWVYYYSLQIFCPGGLSFGFGTSTYASRPDYIDLNADGRTDVVYRGGTTQFRFRFSTGTGFTSEYFGPTITGYTTNPIHIFDWDRDGNEDVLLTNTSTNTLHLMRSTGVGLATPVETGVASRPYITATDINGDGLTDLGFVNGSTWAFRLHSGVYPDLLLSATDGFGVTDIFSYAALPNYNNHTKGAGATFPVQDVTPVMQVVSNLQSSTGTGSSSLYALESQSYTGARVDLQGRGFLGFSFRSWRDSRDQTVQRRFYRQDFPYVGAVFDARRSQSDGTLISHTERTHSNFPFGSGFAMRYFPYPSQIVDRAYEAGGVWNGALLRTVTTANQFETTGGTLYDQTVTTTEPSSGANGVTAGGSWVERTYMPLANFLNDTPSWCIGRPGLIQQVNSHNLTSGTELARAKYVYWNAAYCRPVQTADEPWVSALTVTTDIEYDSFGNVNRTTMTGTGMLPRATWTSYAHPSYPGQFPTSVTNALFQSTGLSWNYALAVPTSSTDPNNLVTSWQYDNFGRQTYELQPDGTYTTTTISACPTCDPSTLKTLVDNIHYASGGAMVQRDFHYLDQFDRAIYDYELRNTGSGHNLFIRRFDAFGNVAYTYDPFLSSGLSAAGTTVTYDLLNRPTLISRPTDENISATKSIQIQYLGLTTRIIDAKNKISERKMSAAGHLARVLDHDGYYQNFDYDAFGNPKRVFDGSTELQSSIYNVRGMLTSRTDKDMGTWIYDPNALGEVVHVRDAKTSSPNWTQTLTYDLLGRLTSRQEAEGTSNWVWGTSATAKNINRLDAVSGPGYSEGYVYDSVGRLSTKTFYADTNYQIGYTYNAFGALDTLTYPASTGTDPLKLKYEYQYGYSYRIRECATPACTTFGTTFWTADAYNARSQITQATLGNGLVINRGFDAVTGWLKSIKTGPGTTSTIQDLAYEWDLVGNLKKRKDINQSNLTEEFFYDNLHRLDESKLNNVTNLDMAYDLLGNITSKSDVGTYTYHASKKHQVTSTSNGWSFGYDANGNMEAGRGAAMTWTSYNLPSQITKGGLTSNFYYTPDRQYHQQTATFSDGTATTRYIGGLLEKVTTSAGTDYKHMIRVDGARIIVSRRTDAQNVTWYALDDHLGSNSTVTTGAGALQVVLSYDAFGARRGSNWVGSPSSGDWTNVAGTTRRGYTDHTMLDNLGLIHMNGRVQDPVLGRFISADPFIPDPSDTQSYNRYSYVLNNPLTFTDPSGFTEDGPRWTPSWTNWTTPWVWPNFPTYRPPAVVSPCGSNSCVNNDPVPAIAAASASPCDLMPCGALPGVAMGLDGGEWNDDRRRAGEQLRDYMCTWGVWCDSEPGEETWGRQAREWLERPTAPRREVFMLCYGSCGPLLDERGVPVIRETPQTNGDVLLEATILVAPLRAARAAATAENGFFQGTRYSPKVLEQLRRGPGEFHSFPESVTAFEGAGTVRSITGGDGVVRQMLEIPGSYSGRNGVFQFMKEADGTINHRVFVPGP